MTYFIHKEGVHYGGVYWIGSTLHEAHLVLQELIDSDRDDYHNWCIYEYLKNKDGDNPAKHKLVMQTRKGEPKLYRTIK